MIVGEISMTSEAFASIILVVLGAVIIIGLTIHNWVLLVMNSRLRKQVLELETKIAAWVAFYEGQEHE